MTNREKFLEIVKEIKRPGIDALVEWLSNGSDFFTAPASTKYHGAYEGGLVEHSLDVYDCFKKIQSAFPDIKIPEESVIIATLFHDICKVNFYGTEMRNRKNEKGEWEKYPVYNVTEKFCYGGHGSKSVFILQNYMKLTPEEAVAINCHMGFSDGNNQTNAISSAYEQYPLAWMVHVADEAAAYLLGR